jgi:hypothetical protein
VATTQDNWRFCTKCYSLYFNGYPTTGVCPSGGSHSPFESASPTHAGSSIDFQLQAVNTGPPPGSPGTGAGQSDAGYQANWRFCTKCYSLFWWGDPTGGVCAAGGEHSPLESVSPTHAASSWDFELRVAPDQTLPQNPGTGGGPADANYQANWRFCTKCYSLFWWGYPTGGVCPHGGQHSPLESASQTHAASSLNFELAIVGGVPSPPSPPTQSPPTQSPPPTSDDDDDGWGDDDDDGDDGGGDDG